MKCSQGALARKLVACLGSLCLGLAYDASHGGGGLFVLVLAGLAVLGSIGYGIKEYNARPNAGRYQELWVAREKMQSQLPARQRLNVSERAAELFSKKGSQELSEIMTYRQSLIRQVMGQIEDYDQFLLTAG